MVVQLVQQKWCNKTGCQMFRKQILRPMPASAKLIDGGKKARVVIKGESRTYPVSETGKLIDFTPRWYCRIAGKTIALTASRDESRQMELELQLDHSRGAKKPAGKIAPKSRRELAGLIDEWLAEQYGPGCGLNPGHIGSFTKRIKLLADAGITTVGQLELPTASGLIQESLDRLGVDKPMPKLDSGDKFTPQSIYELLGLNRSTVLRRAQTLGCAGIGRKKGRYYSRAEAETIIAAAGRGAAPATQHGYRLAITSFCRWLIAKGILTKMPSLPRRRVKLKTIHPRRAINVATLNSLTASVIASGKVLGNLTAQARAVLYLTAFWTALRLRALREVRCDDLLRHGDEWALAVRAEADKTGSARRIPLPAELGKALSELCGARRVMQDPIWPFIPKSFALPLRADLRDAGIPLVTADGKFDFHAFRHSAATHFLAKGVSPLVVARLGGWHSLKMLQDRYGHLDASNLGDLLKGGW